MLEVAFCVRIHAESMTHLQGYFRETVIILIIIPLFTQSVEYRSRERTGQGAVEVHTDV
jgi:hypothetical protein